MAELEEDELQELEDDGEAVDYEDYDLEEEDDEEELQGPGMCLVVQAHALAGGCALRVLQRGCAGCLCMRKSSLGPDWHRRWRGGLAAACICAACDRLSVGCPSETNKVLAGGGDVASRAAGANQLAASEAQPQPGARLCQANQSLASITYVCLSLAVCDRDPIGSAGLCAVAPCADAGQAEGSAVAAAAPVHQQPADLRYVQL